MVCTLFRHPTIHTLTGRRPGANAIAVSEGVIQAVGDFAELAEQAPRGFRTVELPGGALVPGFHDAHIHSGGYARELDALDMRGAGSLDEALARLRAYANAHPGTGWIFGGRWDSNAWTVPVQPTRHDLDRICPDRPVALPSVDGHTTWANTLALRAVNLTRDSPDPIGGEIVREADGHPTGILRESARDSLKDLMGSPLSGDLGALLRRAQEKLLSVGLTSITDIDGEEVRDAYLEMRAAGELRLRVHKAIPLSFLDQAIEAGRFTGQGDDWVTTGPVKIFSDGALGSHTAHMNQDFAGEPGNHGIEIVPFAELRETVRRATEARIAVATHAIGDRANQLILDVYEEFAELTAARGLRHRVEHAQHMRPEDVLRFARLGVIPSSQPTHCTSDIPLSNSLLSGRDLANYPWRQLADAGAVLAFGSDAPVEEAEPMFGIHAAVTRQDPSGQPLGGWEPHQRVSVLEALEAYSAGSAYAAGQEQRLGRIAPGQLADFVALAEDPTTVAPAALRDLPVLTTVVGGEIRYERPA